MLKFLSNWNKKTPKAAQTVGDLSLVIGTAAGVAALLVPGVPAFLTVAAVAGGVGKIMSKLFAVDPTDKAVEVSESINDVSEVVTDIKDVIKDIKSK